ncbi:MAG TPA: hypothetical protein VFD19_03605 [Clostridia bacterium]|nr:hypothetical protein [Clostridia bacterium]
MSKNKQKILLIVAGVLLLATAVVLIYEFAIAPQSGKRVLPELAGYAQPSDIYDPDLLAPSIVKAMEKRLFLAPAMDDQVHGPWLVSAYETSLKRGEEGIRTSLIRASDQIMYGRALARLGKRSDFLKWAHRFDLAFRSGDTTFHATCLRCGDLPDDVYQQVGAHWSVTLAYSRALLEGYRTFGGKTLTGLIESQSTRLLPLFQGNRTHGDLLAGPKMLSGYDEWDDPPPGSIPEPGDDPPVETATGTYLADIDLWALYALSRFDPGWAPVALSWHHAVAESRLESELPLYASAIEKDKDTYLAVTGGGSFSQTREQLGIALHLAEVGTVDRDFISFIRSQLRDNKRLPSGWNPVTSGAQGSLAVPADYGLALSLGRASGDPVLLSSAREVMMYSYASSATSDIYGGWFRPGESAGTFKLVAEDNVAVLLALR